MENAILSPGVIVAPGAVVRNSVLMHGCSIGSGAKIEEAILDKNVTVGDRAVLGCGSAEKPNQEHPDHVWSGLVLAGKGARLPAGCEVGRNCIIYPATTERDYETLKVSAGETIHTG